MKRYTDEELLAMLNDIEADYVERKESLSSSVRKKAREAICAFSNDLPDRREPGVLFIGACDDGSPSHVPITDEMQRTLADMKSDGNILPLPTMTVEKRTLKGEEMLVVTVAPSDMPPVRYDGRICIRTGSRRGIASQQDERILNERRRYKNIPFDIYPVPNASISDLSRVIFENEYLPSAIAPDVLEANNRSYEERLASCKMIVSSEEPTPTVLGLLTLGKSPQDYLPGARVQFLRISGTELADPVIDEEDIGGSLAEILRQTEDKMRSHNRVAVDAASGATHQITEQYPLVAIQQLLYNAVFHRTYESTNSPVRVNWFDDRIEIHSPGGPYGNVTPDNFGVPGVTDYRNPNIADVLKDYGFVQSFGRGLAMAEDAMKENGNPEIEYECNASTVLCTLRRTP